MIGSFVASTIALGRTWRGRLILIVLATQLLLPLRYYLVNRDPHDERFAWRMFSPMRMSKCTPHFFLDGKPLPLASQYHEAWLELAGRGRFGVLEAIGADQCAKHPGAHVHASLDCSYLDAPARRFEAADLCTDPQLGHGEDLPTPTR